MWQENSEVELWFTNSWLVGEKNIVLVEKWIMEHCDKGREMVICGLSTPNLMDRESIMWRMNWRKKQCDTRAEQKICGLKTTDYLKGEILMCGMK
jgi:hypothetical protein